MFRNYFVNQDPPNMILLLPGEVGVIDVVGDLDIGHIIIRLRYYRPYKNSTFLMNELLLSIEMVD